MAAKVTSKGQITIPKRVREALGLKPGTRVEFSLEEGRAVLTAAPGGIEELYGSLNRYLPKGKRLPDDVVEQVRREVAHAAALEGRARRHKRSS